MTTTPSTSAEIVRLCKEKGIDPPEINLTEVEFTTDALLMWGGWRKWAVSVERFPRGDGTVRFYAGATKDSIFGVKLEEEREAESPVEALGLLLIEYLRDLPSVQQS